MASLYCRQFRYIETAEPPAPTTGAYLATGSAARSAATPARHNVALPVVIRAPTPAACGFPGESIAARPNPLAAAILLTPTDSAVPPGKKAPTNPIASTPAWRAKLLQASAVQDEAPLLAGVPVNMVLTSFDVRDRRCSCSARCWKKPSPPLAAPRAMLA